MLFDHFADSESELAAVDEYTPVDFLGSDATASSSESLAVSASESEAGSGEGGLSEARIGDLTGEFGEIREAFSASVAGFSITSLLDELVSESESELESKCNRDGADDSVVG